MGVFEWRETPRLPREVRTVRFPVRARNRPHRHLRILTQYRMQFRQIDPTMARNHPRADSAVRGRIPSQSFWEWLR